MKKAIIGLALLSTSYSCIADHIYKHNGDVIECEIQSVERDCIKFTFKNEKATNIIGRYAIDKVVFDSGREQKISDKIDPKGGEKNIIVTDDPNEVVGLKEVKALKSHSDNDWNFGSANSLDEKATKKLRKQAAKEGAVVILISRENVSSSAFSKSSTKKGICYSYQ